MRKIVILTLILFSLRSVSLKAQETNSRYKIPSAVNLQQTEKLETNIRLLFIESGVAGAVGISCLTAGIVKMKNAPDYSAHFNQEHKKQYDTRRNAGCKVLIGLGAGFSVASVVLSGLGVKYVYMLRTHKANQKLQLDLGLSDDAAVAAKLLF